MRILIPGGSGYIGRVLTRAFLADGHQVVVLSRRPKCCACPAVEWDGEHLGPWVNELEDIDALINLTGRSVDCRYSDRNRRLILESRINSTRIIGEAISQATSPPRVWLQASTATIYAHRYHAPNDEATGILGGSEPAPDTWKFSIDVATAWEEALTDAPLLHTRKVLLRSAMTMHPDRGSVFDVLLSLVRWRLGGCHGNGRQYVSWIHEYDFVASIYWLIENDIFDGPVNIASPNPIEDREFMRILRTVWGTRIGLRANEWMLEIGTFLLRTESELILKSRRVVPGRLLESGFRFQFPDWSDAASELCRRWRQMRRRGSTKDLALSEWHQSAVGQTEVRAADH